MSDDYDCSCDHDCDVTVDSGSSSSGNRSGGCFIATAAYGSYSESHVLVLREFRDNVLYQSGFGRLFIRCYYKASPPIAHLIASRDYAKKLVRALLKPVVYLAGKISKSTIADHLDHKRI